MRIHFVFLGEGSSDDGLIPHLESLCIESGADEVTGVSPDFRRLPERIGHTVEAKLAAALALEPNANLVFVHRDADARTSDARYAEIHAAIEALGCTTPIVCVVPVQATEAWLLTCGAAIRRTVGRPHGRVHLRLPAPTALERVARPKELLQSVLVLASEATGRRLERVRRDFPQYRRALLQDLPTSGRIELVPSWLRLKEDLRSRIEGMGGLGAQ